MYQLYPFCSKCICYVGLCRMFTQFLLPTTRRLSGRHRSKGFIQQHPQCRPQLNPSSSAPLHQPLCNQLSRSTTISIASIPTTSFHCCSTLKWEKSRDIKLELQYKRNSSKTIFRVMEVFPGFGRELHQPQFSSQCTCVIVADCQSLTCVRGQGRERTGSAMQDKVFLGEFFEKLFGERLELLVCCKMVSYLIC